MMRLITVFCVIAVINSCEKCFLKIPRFHKIPIPIGCLASSNNILSNFNELSIIRSRNSDSVFQTTTMRMNQNKMGPIHDFEFHMTPTTRLQELMIAWIRWYRSTLSPFMPPNCRFFPSCSNYAIESVEQFGAWRGGILIAWRLIRCNPTGGSGYDPPIWPPPNYRAGSTTKKWF